MAWVSNYVHCFAWDLITYPCLTATVEVRVWISNYIPLSCIDVITYPCPNPDAESLTSVRKRAIRWITHKEHLPRSNFINEISHLQFKVNANPFCFYFVGGNKIAKVADATTVQLSCPHDDVIEWRQFPRYWPFARGTHRIPLIKASDAELWCFLWSAPKQTVQTPVIWAIALIMSLL